MVVKVVSAVTEVVVKMMIKVSRGGNVVVVVE